MPQNNITSKTNTPRRNFLKQSAGVAGAVFLGSSLLHAQTASPADTLTATDLEVAGELIAEGGQPLYAVLVLEHVEALAKQGRTQDIEGAVAVIRRHVTANTRALGRKRGDETPAQTFIDNTRAHLKAIAAETTTD